MTDFGEVLNVNQVVPPGTEPLKMNGGAKPPARSTAAERMRLYRKRRRDGMQYVRIPLHVTDIDGLIRMRLLKEERRLRNPSAPRLCLRTGRAAHRRGLPGALGVRPRLCAPPRLSRRPGWRRGSLSGRSRL